MGKRTTPLLGAHMSIAGGLEKSVQRARQATCDCLQLFTKNNNQWRARELDEAEAERFRSALIQENIAAPIAHSSYLINLASPDPALWKKSVDAFIEELLRIEKLGIRYLVQHPGAFTTSSETEGLKRIAQALDEADRQTVDLAAGCLLENTAGQGSNLGWKFEHLAWILDHVQNPDRLGICIDTCHAFAAGYPMQTRKDYLATIRQLNQTVGTEVVKAFHLNDSKREFGSRVDRHDHIGQGHLGTEPFRHLLNDRRFRAVPMYLETPKGNDPESGEDWDLINLRILRALVG